MATAVNDTTPSATSTPQCLNARPADLTAWLPAGHTRGPPALGLSYATDLSSCFFMYQISPAIAGVRSILMNTSLLEFSLANIVDRIDQQYTDGKPIQSFADIATIVAAIPCTPTAVGLNQDAINAVLTDLNREGLQSALIHTVVLARRPCELVSVCSSLEIYCTPAHLTSLADLNRAIRRACESLFIVVRRTSLPQAVAIDPTSVAVALASSPSDVLITGHGDTVDAFVDASEDRSVTVTYLCAQNDGTLDAFTMHFPRVRDSFE